MALPRSYGSDIGARISFLQLFVKVCANVPVAQNGVTRATVLCVMFEETYFYNRVQWGREDLAAKFDSGATLSQDEKDALQDVGVGFGQVQIKDGTKGDVISGLGRDPNELKFSDVTSNNDFSVGLGCRWLLFGGIQGQLGNHPNGAALTAAWQAAAPFLGNAIKAGDVTVMRKALNAAIPDKGRRVPPESEYWDIIFPANEMELLTSSAVRGLAAA